MSIPGPYGAAPPPAAAPLPAPPAGHGPSAPAQPGPLVQFDRWLDRRGVVLDVVLAILAFLTLGLLSLATGAGSGSILDQVLTVVATLGMPAALAVRRIWPVASAVAINALALLHFLPSGMVLPVDLLIYVSVYSTTVHAPLWARRLSLGSALFGSALVAATLLQGSFSSRFETIAQVVIFFFGISAPALLSWAFGLLRRSTKQRWESLMDRAERLERERDQQAQLATAAERSRIAREMHDVVAHSLSVIIAQADGGRYAAASSPEAATQALSTISSTGRSALADMRRILGVLRVGGQLEPMAGADMAPQPTTQDIATLIDQVRTSGLAVNYAVSGRPLDLPSGMSLALYRICQEALTNILKHGGPAASAQVSLDWQGPRVMLTISDDGRGAAAPSDGAGHGLLGMRERVALFGGTLEAGPRPGGGFHVRATIPLPGVTR